MNWRKQELAGTHCAGGLVDALHVDAVHEEHTGRVLRVARPALYSQGVHAVLKICLRMKRKHFGGRRI